MACMIRVEFGSTKAEKIIDTWISGYNIPAFKQVIEDNLKSVLDIADSAVSVKQCRHWVVMATRYNEFQVPSLSNIQIVTDYLTDKLSIGGGSLAKVGPYTGSIVMRCLQTKLDKEEKERASILVGVGQQFSYQLLGAAMARILGHHSSADLLRILAHELNRASNLEREEVRKRVRFLVSGFKLSEICRKLKSDQDCLEAVEADFSAHTPAGEHLPHLQTLLPHPALGHPALGHPVLDHPVLGHPMADHPQLSHHPVLDHPLHQDALQTLPELAPLKPKKPSPGKVGGNPLTHKVESQPLTHKQDGNHPLHLKIGADHPGISVSQQNDHTALLEHALNHHITEDWPLDVHPEHLTTSADELVDKVNSMDNPLITAITENKNPALLKLLEESGSPELLQTLLNSQVPIKDDNTPNLGQLQLSNKEKAKMRLKQLLAAFKGNKQRLTKAIKARAKLRLLSYLQNHKNAKLLSLMKMKYKEPLMQELGFHHGGQTPQMKMQSLLRLNAKPKTKEVTAKELLQLLKLQHGVHHAKFNPSKLQPGKDILDELKVELGSLGFKHKQKPAEYVDNTLVNFGNTGFAGVGLPIDEHAADVMNYLNRKHHNPFQYEEDWKGSIWSSKKHQQHGNPQQSIDQEHHSESWMPEHSRPSQSYGGISEKVTAGQEANGFAAVHSNPGLTPIDDTAATFGSINEENTNKENLKNVLKDVANNGMDSSDVETLLTNLPGIIGHQIDKQEVNTIMAQLGKKEGQPFNSVRLPAINEQASPGEQYSSYHPSQTPGSPATIQQQLQPQKIVEQVELTSTEQGQDKGSLSNGPAGEEMSQMNEGTIDMHNMGNSKVSFAKEGEEDVVDISPNQKEIHVNALEGNSDATTTDQLAKEQDNYAGVTENDKPQVDLLNLNGKIQGIEGLDSASDMDGAKMVENLLSTDATPSSQADQETVNELKEQAEFDANALSTVHQLGSVKPTTINTNYLESFDNDNDDGSREFSSKLANKPSAIDTNYLETIDAPISSRLSDKPTAINANYLESFDNDNADASALKKSGTKHDAVEDYMTYIHKQDAVDESYAKQYYKNSDNPMTAATSSLFQSDVDFDNFDKKTLKNKSKKGRQNGNQHKLDVKKGNEMKGKQKFANGKKQVLRAKGLNAGNTRVNPKSSKDFQKPVQLMNNAKFKNSNQQGNQIKGKGKLQQNNYKFKTAKKNPPAYNLKKAVLTGGQGVVNKIVEYTDIRNKNNPGKNFRQQKGQLKGVKAKDKQVMKKLNKIKAVKQTSKTQTQIGKQKRKGQKKTGNRKMSIL